MSGKNAAEKLKILNTENDLGKLTEMYPDIWKEINVTIKNAMEKGSPEAFSELMTREKTISDVWKEKIKSSGINPSVVESAFPYMIRAKMTFLALDKLYLAASSGVTSGKVRFSFLNGYVLQKLLFHYGFERKPVSLFWFNFFWRFITQKKILMPLVNKKGIYCFYTKNLIDEILKIAGDRPCLEIAAGDGTLSRFLKNRGLNITATDDYSWGKNIKYAENVEKLDAKKALEKYAPKIVVCSWPPPANNFEKFIFSSPCVEKYIFIGSRYEYASGNWDEYRKQTEFDFSVDEKLSGCVLPPDHGNIVMVFKRKE